MAEPAFTVPPGWEWTSTVHPSMTPSGSGWQVLGIDGPVTHYGRPRCACTPERGVLDCPLHRPADTVTVDITPDITRVMAALSSVQAAIAPLVIAELRARLAEVRRIAERALTGHDTATAILAALDGPTPKDQT